MGINFNYNNEKLSFTCTPRILCHFQMSVNAIQIRSFDEKKDDAKEESKEEKKEEKAEEKKDEKAEEKKDGKGEEKKEAKKDEEKEKAEREAKASEHEIETKKRNEE